MSDLAEKTTDPLVEVLTKHFVMWHDLDGPLAAEWRCACGRTFTFSDSGIAHVATILTAAGYGLIEDERERIALAIEAERDRWTTETATGRARHDAYNTAECIARSAA